jgi:hypothetical protein
MNFTYYQEKEKGILFLSEGKVNFLLSLILLSFSFRIWPKNFNTDSDRLLSTNLSKLKRFIKQGFW